MIFADVDAPAIRAFHDARVADRGWAASGASAYAGGPWQWIEANHRCNSLLWDEEDLARRRDVPAEAIAANNRAIDGYNQRRNDATEKVDEQLLARLSAVVPRPDAWHNSETAGAMIDRLSSDSRRCAPGVAFLAYPGEALDGRRYVGDAVGRGAAAILWEKRGFDWRAEWRVPNVPIEGLKQQASALAHEFYGRPSESLWVCGVTGTNGKTSCSQWIAALLDKAAVIGTLGAGFPGALSALTVP